MNKSIIYAIIAFILYFIQNIFYSLLTGAMRMNELGALGISSTITILLTFILLRNKSGMKYYGVSIAKKTNFTSLNIIVIALPLMNLPYLINPAEVNFNSILLRGVYVGFMEEIIFRGFLYRGIEEKNGTRKAIIVSSIIFGIYHVVNIGSMPTRFVILQVIYATAIGIIFAVIFSMTQSLVLCMGVHALIDVISFYGQELIPAVEYIVTIICILLALYYWYLNNKEKSIKI